MYLEQIDGPEDLRRLSQAELVDLSAEIRSFIVDAVAGTGGHRG